MRAHITLAIGILIGAIFAWRGANALIAPGIGINEFYIAGGLILAGWLMLNGSRELLARWNSRRRES